MTSELITSTVWVSICLTYYNVIPKNHLTIKATGKFS